MILLLAANTAFADFPRLSNIMARDGFLPRQMGNLGDRLVFSNGIILLGLLASFLILVFNGDTHGLLPLYAVGVFISFTLSQWGMVRRWFRLRTSGWWHNAIINAFGGHNDPDRVFDHPRHPLPERGVDRDRAHHVFSLILTRIHRHYESVAHSLSLDTFGPPPRMHNPRVIIPIGGVHRGVLKALAFARTLSPDVTAVYVETSEDEGMKIRERWSRWGDGVRLEVIKSPYRSIAGPLIKYLNQLGEQRQPGDVITVVLPQFIPGKWWENLLHNQTAWPLRLALLFREGYIVIDVPYHLSDVREQRELA